MPKKAEKAHAGDGKRYPVNVRVTFELRRDLERAADETGRSLTQELESRLETSLAKREHLEAIWGWDLTPIFQAVAQALWRIEMLTEKRWWEDEQTCELFKRTTAVIIENYRRIISQDLLESKPGTLKLTLDQSPDELAAAIAAAVGIGPPMGPKDDKAVRRARISTALKEAHNRMALTKARPLAIEEE
jgi:hypothetical protein